MSSTVEKKIVISCYVKAYKNKLFLINKLAK